MHLPLGEVNGGGCWALAGSRSSYLVIVLPIQRLSDRSASPQESKWSYADVREMLTVKRKENRRESHLWKKASFIPSGQDGGRGVCLAYPESPWVSRSDIKRDLHRILLLAAMMMLLVLVVFLCVCLCQCG